MNGCLTAKARQISCLAGFMDIPCPQQPEVLIVVLQAYRSAAADDSFLTLLMPEMN